jgi:glycosyltransferase involved in cell wall biosynthesis
MNLSVVICTWNRAHLLDQTLRQMHDMRVPSGIDWELLVVDNNSTDSTPQVLASHAEHLPLVHMFEGRTGKSYAANQAVEKARGELVLWTDDDVLVAPNWMEEYVKAADAFPGASFFGGTIDPWFTVSPPHWIRAYLVARGPYAVQQLGEEVRPMTPREAPIGANMAVRAQSLRKFRFDERLGTFRDLSLPAEDGDLFARMKAKGHTGVWVGPARVKHYIGAERLTRKYVWNWYRNHGRTLALRNGDHGGPACFGVPRWALRRYLEQRTASFLLLPFRNEAWVKAYTESARMLGLMQQSRKTLRTAHPPHA